MATTVADMLIDRLADWKVDTIFGFPGDGINGIFEALRTHQEKIKFIQVRHEEAAAFAACGHAKYTGTLGVCLATSGPGGIHLLNGLYDAKCDCQPVLAITGNTFSDLINTRYQQDVDLVKLFMDVSVYSERVMGPAHLPNVVDEAIRSALARRGVAHICIPKDIQELTASDSRRSGDNVARHSQWGFAANPTLPAAVLVQDAAGVINAGSKVVILAGRGAIGCAEEVVQLAQKVGGPVIKPLLGKAVIPDDSPYTTGGIGLLGTAASQDAMKACDTLLIAGSSFPYMEFYPKPGNARIVQIDSNPERIGLRCPVEVGLSGDCKAVLGALLPLIQPKKDQSFLATAQKNMKQWNELMEKRGTNMAKPLKPQVVAYTVNKLLDDDAIIASDCGTVTSWSARYLQHARRRCCSRPPGCWRRWATASPTPWRRRRHSPAGR